MNISSAGFNIPLLNSKKRPYTQVTNQGHKIHTSSTSASQVAFKGAFQLFESPLLPQGKEKHRGLYREDWATYAAKPIPPGPFNPAQYVSDAIIGLKIGDRTVQYGLADDDSGNELTQLRDMRTRNQTATGNKARDEIKREYKAFKDKIIQNAKKPRGYMYFLNNRTGKYDLWFKHGGDYRQEHDWNVCN